MDHMRVSCLTKAHRMNTALPSNLDCNAEFHVQHRTGKVPQFRTRAKRHPALEQPRRSANDIVYTSGQSMLDMPFCLCQMIARRGDGDIHAN